MSKTKIAIMDDSQAETEVKSQKSKVKNKEQQTEVKPDASSDVITNEGKQSIEKIATEPEAPRNDEVKKPKKPGKAKPRSKKYKEATKELDRSLTYSLNEAVEMAKKLSYSKFTGTLEAHINTTQTGIRGLVSLPFSSGKKLRILAFGKDADASGADLIGTDEIIDEINKGKINFDLVVTTPEWMSKLAKVARILGPRSLMPNPKNGTITSDLKKAVEGFQAGKTEYKTESKGFVIHIGLGKLDQPTEQLSANIKTLLQTLGKTRVKKVSLAPTQGPSVKLNLANI